ncbi:MULTISPECIES: hypothetical protein [unclassified Streptomyces]|nr:hypothetical protein OIE76_13140 [Streptomyces sp. NBC_01727]
MDRAYGGAGRPASRVRAALRTGGGVVLPTPGRVVLRTEWRVVLRARGG